MNAMEFCKRYIRAMLCVFVVLIQCGGGIVLLMKDDMTYGILLMVSVVVALLLAGSEFYDVKRNFNPETNDHHERKNPL